MKTWWWRVRYAYWWWFYTDLGALECWNGYAIWVEEEFMEDPPRDVAFSDIVSLLDPEAL